MFDKIGQRINYTGDDNLIIRQRLFFKHAKLMRMAAIGKRQHETAHVELAQDRPDGLQRHVAIVRPLVIAPAHMHAHAVARHVAQRVIDRRHGALYEIQERRFGLILIGAVPFQRQVRAIHLQ